MNNQQTYKEKYGPWALVTGASSGIGEQFAHQLAAAGIHVAVAARRRERLQALTQALEKKHGIQTRAIPVDLTASDFLVVIESATSDLEVGLLVNNAGAAVPGAFLKQDIAARTQIVQLNVTAPMQLAHHFGAKMAANGRGGIIFIASIAGYIGSPYMANYAATKAYLLNLGASLNVELKPKGIDVLVLSPGATRTEMVQADGMDFSKVPMSWMSANEVAAIGIKSLGRKAAVIPGGINRMMNFMTTRVIPRQTALNMFGNMMSKGMDSAIL